MRWEGDGSLLQGDRVGAVGLAIRNARERMTAYADDDAGSAMLAVFILLAAVALFPELVSNLAANDASKR